MSILKLNQENSDLFFVTLKITNDLPVFINENYFNIILNSLSYCQKNKAWSIYAYTILINHIHLVLQLPLNLHDAIRDLKSFTSKIIIKQLKIDNQFDILKEMETLANNTKKQNYKVWRKNIWPQEIETDKFLWQKINYTDMNAESHGVVDDIEKYLYTSYHNHHCNHDVVFKTDNLQRLY